MERACDRVALSRAPNSFVEEALRERADFDCGVVLASLGTAAGIPTLTFSERHCFFACSLLFVRCARAASRSRCLRHCQKTSIYLGLFGARRPLARHSFNESRFHVSYSLWLPVTL